MLLTAIELVVSSSIYVTEVLVKVVGPYAFLKIGTRVEETFDDLCDILAKDVSNNKDIMIIL